MWTGAAITRAEIDATVTRLMKAGEVTGAGITIFNGGKVAYSKTYGYRDAENKLPLTQESVLGAASFTKVAFAYLVMQLVETHTLELDKPIDEYLPKRLPEYPNYQDLAGDPRYKKITVRMLLSHTAGFSNFRTLNRDLKLHIYFEPGSKYAYSGEGIMLLAVSGGDGDQTAVAGSDGGAGVQALGDVADEHGNRGSVRGRLRQRLRRIWAFPGAATAEKRGCSGVDADHSARLHPIHAGGDGRARDCGRRLGS